MCINFFYSCASIVISPELGRFHGSLRREQQQRKLQELPLQLKLVHMWNYNICGLISSLLILSLQPPPVPSSAAAAAAAVSATATDNLTSKAKAESISKASYESETTKIKSGLLAKTKLDKNTGGMGNGV